VGEGKEFSWILIHAKLEDLTIPKPSHPSITSNRHKAGDGAMEHSTQICETLPTLAPAWNPEDRKIGPKKEG